VTQLNVLLTHQAAASVDANVRYLRAAAPEARFVVAHGGRREDFERVAHPEKLYVDDPTLRAAPRTFQSYHATLGGLHAAFVRDDADVAAAYVFEWDHLVLRSGFEAPLTELARRHGAGFMGKTCVERTATNWHHYTRFRRDAALLAHLREHSVRDDPTRLFGTLGSGFWISRDALAAYVAVPERPLAYGELYLPTLIHHLGFRVVDIDADGDLYRHVRYEPELSLADVLAIKRAGGWFAHPFKQTGAYERILAEAAA
jgi:hypothetical protein